MISNEKDKLMSLKKSYRYKVVLIGDQAVGKSSIISRYISNEFQQLHNPTIGIDFLSKVVTLPNQITVRLQLWDTAGQQRFRSLIPGYLRDCSKIIIVFDLSSKRSFDSIKTWIQYAQQIKGLDADLVIVGNKCDLPRQVTFPNPFQQYSYYQISAKQGTGVQQMFIDICQNLVNKTTQSMIQQQKGQTRLFSKSHKKKLCC